MDFQNTIVLALIGAFATIIIQWLATNVIPALAIKMQKDEPRIGGKWRTTFEEDKKEYHESVTLKQRGRKVDAKIEFQ
ncbi:hypothetical protein KKC97_02890, partial [bacterium]|nr:hypothetical protein [bacterium]